ncbi:hypothetical protein FZW96_11440 [Bacillus sp. BGMRC 2118]|nr:hypothetical protein FZW96_11440 [Bacillus sp. BGMRC 2118]
MTVLKLNNMQSIFLVVLLMLILPILWYLAAPLTGKTAYIPLNVVIVALLGSPIAKKLLNETGYVLLCYPRSLNQEEQ